DSQIILEKNEDYHREGLPKLDRVIYQVIPDNGARVIALKSGEVDIIDDVNPDEAASIEADDELELYARHENNIGFLGFNTEKAPLDDKLVRQATTHGIDTQSIVDALYAGYATPAVNLIPPNYLGHNDELAGYEYSAEKAKELLAEAGYEEGLEIDLWVMPV